MCLVSGVCPLSGVTRLVCVCCLGPVSPAACGVCRTELEAQASTAEDERRALVERCLDSERELDHQKASVVELRRKLDDTTAALQELARENQLLQVSQSLGRSVSPSVGQSVPLSVCLSVGPPARPCPY